MARVFSGIQPTGTKHLGNYIGAIRHYVADQDKGEAFYCVVDLHAISVPYEPAALPENTLGHGRHPAGGGSRPGPLHAVRAEPRGRPTPTAPGSSAPLPPWASWAA